jgi:hypothetical protein
MRLMAASPREARLLVLILQDRRPTAGYFYLGMSTLLVRACVCSFNVGALERRKRVSIQSPATRLIRWRVDQLPGGQFKPRVKTPELSETYKSQNIRSDDRVAVRPRALEPGRRHHIRHAGSLSLS